MIHCCSCHPLFQSQPLYTGLSPTEELYVWCLPLCPDTVSASVHPVPSVFNIYNVPLSLRLQFRATGHRFFISHFYVKCNGNINLQPSCDSFIPHWSHTSHTHTWVNHFVRNRLIILHSLKYGCMCRNVCIYVRQKPVPLACWSVVSETVSDFMCVGMCIPALVFFFFFKLHVCAYVCLREQLIPWKAV